MKKIKAKFLKHPYIYSAIILVIIIIIGISTLSGNGNDKETVVMDKTTLKRQVSVSGKVISSESAELGFEQSGKIAQIYSPVGTAVKKGEIVAKIENSDVYAEVLQKQANLEKEQFKLNSLEKGTRPEQIAIYRQAKEDAERALDIALDSAKLDMESTLLNDIDSLFNDGDSANPTLQFNTGSEEEKRNIEKERLYVTEKFAEWDTDPKAVLLSIRTFVEHLFTVVSNLSEGTSGLDQTDIDEYKNTLNEAKKAISASTNEVQEKQSAFNTASNTLALGEAGNTTDDISVQRTATKIAQAELISAEARLAKTMITAPFDGTITKMDIKVGEIVSPNTPKVAIMSVSSFEIESFVPEVHIAYIKIGNPVAVTLDAYGGSETFDASVSYIDPAETVRDGVSTYKVKMTFNNQDLRIRSGMTANANIITLEKPDVFVLPQSAIVTEGENKYIYKQDGDKSIKTKIEVGDRTSLGQIEITDGVDVGDTVILNPEK